MSESPESEPLEIPLPAAEGPAPKTPPRRGRGRPRKETASTAPPAAARTPGRPSVRDQRARKVAGIYTQMGTALMLGGGLISAGAPHAGGAMLDHADDLGGAWADWAETSSRVAKMIDGMAFGGGALAVLFAHAPIIQAIIAGPPKPTPPGDGEASPAMSLGGVLDLFRPNGNVAAG